MNRMISYYLVISLASIAYGMYSCSSAGAMKERCRLKTGEYLRHPEQLLSRFNLLETELKVRMSKVTVGGWLELDRRTYNGKLGGPTWRVRPGDVISVRLINQLSAESEVKRRNNSLQKANSTNLYLQGLHVSPKVNDITVEVAPGKKKTYSYKIGCDHPAGTYWYHPHYDGSALFQTLSGMAGMIVVEDNFKSPDDPKSIIHYSCPLHCDREVHLLFQPSLLYKIDETGMSFVRVQKKIGDRFRNREKLSDGRTVEEWLMGRQNDISLYTTNGQVQPTIRIEQGKKMRFRLVNAGGVHVLEIQSPSSCKVEEIARDGIYLPSPIVPRGGKSILPQGSTMDWLIKCNKKGNFKINSSPNIRENPGIGRVSRYRGMLARLEVVENPKRSFLKSIVATFHEEAPVSLPPLPDYMRNLKGLSQSHVTGKFVVEACVNSIINRDKYEANAEASYRMPLDGVEEWSLLNADSSNSHTVHLQTNHFQIVSYNTYTGPVSIATRDGVTFVDQSRQLCQDSGPTPSSVSLKKGGLSQTDYQPYQGPGTAPVGQWRNTILLPPLSNITVRLQPSQYTGDVFVGSQNLLRSDYGMKMKIKITKKGYRSKLIIKKGGLPGTCRSRDFYPTTMNSRPMGKAEFEGFFDWIYGLKPEYKKKYGDQKYLSSVYAVFLRQYKHSTHTGDHLKNFFQWAYTKFPGYRKFYGDQSYLAELYDYYLLTHVTDIRSHKRE